MSLRSVEKGYFYTRGQICVLPWWTKYRGHVSKYIKNGVPRVKIPGYVRHRKNWTLHVIEIKE